MITPLVNGSIQARVLCSASHLVLSTLMGYRLEDPGGEGSSGRLL